jgi:hypothetical protein
MHSCNLLSCRLSRLAHRNAARLCNNIANLMPCNLTYITCSFCNLTVHLHAARAYLHSAYNPFNLQLFLIRPTPAVFHCCLQKAVACSLQPATYCRQPTTMQLQAAIAACNPPTACSQQPVGRKIHQLPAAAAAFTMRPTAATPPSSLHSRCASSSDVFWACLLQCMIHPRPNSPSPATLPLQNYSLRKMQSHTSSLYCSLSNPF